jgi:hypothetical protein
MRRVVLLAAIIALSATASTTAGAEPSRTIDETFTTDVSLVWNAHSCCTIERVVTGTTSFGSFGRLAVDGTYDLVAHYVEPEPGMTGALALTFESRNGDSFTVTGSSDTFAFGEFPPAAAWEITDSTGRFADMQGSGTYTISGPSDLSDAADQTPVTFTFTGSITK